MSADGAHGDRLFPPEEYAERLARLREHMRARGVAAVLADECEMLAYFTGWAVSLNLYRALVIPLEGEPVMVVRHLDEAPFLAASWTTRRRAFEDVEDPVAIVAEVLAAHGARDGVGLDKSSYAMPVARFEALSAHLPGARFIDFEDVLRPLRLRKSAREVEVLRRAAAVADGAMREAVDSAGPGRSTRDAAAVASAAFVRRGADSGRSGPVTSGRGWDFLHGALGDRPLGPGDVLHLELVPKVGGYCAKLMRPVAIGGASAAQRATAAALVEIQDRQIAAMRPGAIGRDVDAVMREGALAAGLRERYDNNTGYTLGYYFEQAPRTSDFTRVLTPRADWALEPGMVFHVYTSAGGLAFSETVLVGEDGPERLTRIERALFER